MCRSFFFDREPTSAEIAESLDQSFPMLKTNPDERATRINQIADVMKISKRYLLHVYRLSSDQNISETVFQAIFSGIDFMPAWWV